MLKNLTLILLASLASASFTLMAADAPPPVPPAEKPTAITLADLRRDFTDPPMEQRVCTWWHWQGGAVTTDGITKDLEAMKRVGLGGFTLFYMKSGAPINLPASFTAPMFSDKWYEMVRFAMGEAERLSLRSSMHIGPDWAGAAGPWNTAEESMRCLGIGVLPVTGPMKLSEPLPKISDQGRIHPKSWPLVVLALPGKHTAPGSDYNKNLGTGVEVLLKALREPAVSPKQILNLDDKVTADGRIEWEVPAGDWTIIRVVSRVINNAVGQGNCFEPAIIIKHLDTLFGPLLGENASRAKAMRSIFHDSWELASPTWSDSTQVAFEKGRGYDPRPWLPVLCGVTIGDRAQSERFIWDYQRTLSDQYLVHAATIRRWCNTHGVKFDQEGYGMSPNDIVRYQKELDVPMDEFYNETGFSRAKEGKGFCTATADFWGKTVVGNEFMVGDGGTSLRFSYPGMYKNYADLRLAQGHNRIILHTSAHQPFDKGPGLVLLGRFGSDFGRLQTWWEQSKPWIAHINRSQVVLQQTQSVADILSVMDETSVPARKIQFTDGRAEDMCDLDSMSVLKVKNGRIVGPVGQEYAVLLLNFNNPKVQPHCLRELKRLAEAGATIVGHVKPTASPSLQGYPACDEEVKKLADALWDGGKIKPIKELESVLTQMGLVQDFIAAPAQPKMAPLIWSHRRSGGNVETFFVANPGPGKGGGSTTISNDHPWAGEAKFRVTGKVPELWHPARGTMEQIAVWRVEGQQTIIPLRFQSQESYFIVFRDKQPSDLTPLPTQPTDGWIETRGGNRYQQTDLTTTLEVAGPWQVKFQPPKGQGESWEMDFAQLADWAKHADPRVRGFSGTATYKTTFQVKPEQVGGEVRYRLDLGGVEQIAEVRLNGKPLGLVYYKPYLLNVGDGLKAGANELEIEITNTWVNRLIADEALPAEQRQTFDHNNYVSRTKKTNPDPAGLLGPVALRAYREVVVSSKE